MRCQAEDMGGWSACGAQASLQTKAQPHRYYCAYHRINRHVWSVDELEHIPKGAEMSRIDDLPYSACNGFRTDPDAPLDKTIMSFDRLKMSIVSAPSEGEHIIPEHTPISEQGNAPSCTANVACDIAEALIGLEDVSKVVQLARRAAWWLARRQEGTEKEFCGVRLSTMFRVLAEIGACPESVWPYDPPSGNEALLEWATKKPKLAAMEIMSDNKLTGWAQIFEMEEALLDAIDYAIFANHPVGFGTAIDETFRQYRGDLDTVLRPPENPDNVIGRHAIAIFGRRVKKQRRNYLIRNSWGTGYGFNGHVWVDQSYITWSEASSHTVGTRAAELLL